MSVCPAFANKVTSGGLDIKLTCPCLIESLGVLTRCINRLNICGRIAHYKLLTQQYYTICKQLQAAVDFREVWNMEFFKAQLQRSKFSVKTRLKGVSIF